VRVKHGDYRAVSPDDLPLLSPLAHGSLSVEPESGNGSRSVFEFARAYARVAILVLVIAALVGASAFVFSSLRTKMYEATARLVYGPIVDYANPSVEAYSTPAVLEAELQSVGGVIAGHAYRASAEKLVAARFPGHSHYTVSADAVINLTGNSWTAVTARSSNPRVAAAAANAAAAIFLEFRRAAELNQVESQLTATQAQMSNYSGSAARTSNAYLTLFQAALNLKAQKANILKGNLDFRIIAPATAPDKPYAPKPLKTSVLAFLVALVVAVGLAALLEQRDVRLRDAAGVTNALALPLIGVVERVGQTRGESAGYAFATQRDSLLAARTNLDFLLADRGIRSLAVCGSEATDGASLFACDLAASMTLSGRRVALLDCDLGRDYPSQRFALSSGLGVIDVVTDEVALPDAVRAVGVEGGADADPGASVAASIAVLCSGSPAADPRLIITSRRFAALVADCARTYDLAIVMAPPLKRSAEMVALAAAVDGLTCVVDLSAARKRTLESAQALLKGLACDVLGAVALSGRAHVESRTDSVTEGDHAVGAESAETAVELP
jgi:Mrp family chromosome partitioning ATPase